MPKFSFKKFPLAVMICVFFSHTTWALTDTLVPSKLKPGTQKLIYIIGTGGTIAGKASSSVSSNYQSGQISTKSLLADIQNISPIAKVKYKDLLHIDSSDINIADWLKLAAAIDQAAKLKNVTGIVVTHGTDTMEESAYLMHLIAKTHKPIVFVGAMRPASSISADGPLNLYNAIAIAASDQAKGLGVLVLMNDQIFDARDASKTNTTMTDAFSSRQGAALGNVNFGKVHFYKKSLRKHTCETPFSLNDLKHLPRVEIIYDYAGTDGRLFKYAIAENDIQGIIFAGNGDGNIAKPERELITKAIAKNIVIVRSSRTGSGIVTYNYVHNLDSKLGLIPADNLNPQKARILLMLALTKTHNPKIISDYFKVF